MDADAEAQSEAIQQFCALTGASPHEAEHYLAGFAGDLDRAVNLFFENPPSAGGGGAHLDDRGDAPGPVDMTEEDARLAQALMDEENARAGPYRAQPAAAVHPEPEAIEIDQDDDDEDEMLRTLARHREAGLAAAREANRMTEEMMSGARDMLGAHGLPSMFPGLDPNDPRVPRLNGPEGRPAGAAGLAVEGRGLAARASGGRAAARAGLGSHRVSVPVESDEDFDMEEDMDPDAALARRLAQEEDADAALARRLAREDEEAAGLAMAGAASHPPGSGRSVGVGTGGGGPSGDHDHEFADYEHLGVDKHEIEEARMIEAAMMGIPYEPRLPVRGSGGPPSSSAPANPQVAQSRSLRWEQDQAYEESLAADRAKAEAQARAEAEARETARREAEEAAAAERAAAEAAARLAAQLKAKAASLPAEPAAGTPGVVTLMVRLPDGSRLSRRFSGADRLQALFDFIDTQEQNAGLKPNTYRLVNSYPRKVFTSDTSGSLEAAGITADTALFVELV